MDLLLTHQLESSGELLDIQTHRPVLPRLTGTLRRGRDCDGDGDSILLVMDVLLNFSKKFLPSMIGGLMDAPLLIQPLILPKEVQRQAHHMDVAWSYSSDFYSCAEASMSPGDARKKGNVQIIMDRLGKEEQYCNFGFTHDTDTITIKQSRSSYSTLVTLNEKLDRQIEIAQKIAAVNPNDVVKSVLRTHLLPDIIGNTKAFTSQRFRCKSCSAKYRRMPVIGSLSFMWRRASTKRHPRISPEIPPARLEIVTEVRCRRVFAK